MLSLNQYPRAAQRFYDCLKNPPDRGGGLHSWIMSRVNRGFIAGLDPEDIHHAIARAQPRGIRRGEIEEAIDRVLHEQKIGAYTPAPRPSPVLKHGKAALHRMINKGKIEDEVDMIEESPVRLWCEPRDHAALLLETLFKPDDLLWTDEFERPGIPGENIKPAKEHIEQFGNGGYIPPFIIINPLTGELAPRKSAPGETYRGDNNVREYRYCMIEFDDLGLEDQIRFWSAVRLPIVALVFSGGKSIHAWLQVSKLAEITTAEQWESTIKNHLYARLFKPLGADGACSTPAHLSRLPGHYRAEKQSMQRLLWLSSEGRPIC